MYLLTAIRTTNLIRQIIDFQGTCDPCCYCVLLLRPFPPPSLGLPGGSEGKETACNARDLGSIPGQEDPLEEEMATHSSILAWRIPWTGEPGGLQSMGSQRVRHS